METLNIWEWLKTGWGLAVVISGIIGSFFAIRGNIRKLIDEIKKPFTDLKDQITELDSKFDSQVTDLSDKFDDQVNDLGGQLDAQTVAVNQVIETEVHRVETAIKELKHHNEIEDSAMLAILKSDMLRSCEKYIKVGWASTEQKETLNRQLESYIALGGNSFMPKMVAKVMELPIEKPERTLNE